MLFSLGQKLVSYARKYTIHIDYSLFPLGRQPKDGRKHGPRDDHKCEKGGATAQVNPIENLGFPFDGTKVVRESGNTDAIHSKVGEWVDCGELCS